MHFEPSNAILWNKMFKEKPAINCSKQNYNKFPFVTLTQNKRKEKRCNASNFRFVWIYVVCRNKTCDERGDKNNRKTAAALRLAWRHDYFLYNANCYNIFIKDKIIFLESFGGNYFFINTDL